MMIQVRTAAAAVLGSLQLATADPLSLLILPGTQAKAEVKDKGKDAKGDSKSAAAPAAAAPAAAADTPILSDLFAELVQLARTRLPVLPRTEQVDAQTAQACTLLSRTLSPSL